MTSDALLLIGRETRDASELLGTHAGRLADRDLVDQVHVATYESEPARELRGRFREVAADEVFAVPMCAAHTHETLTDVPAALSAVPGAVHYCEPIGQSPAISTVLRERARSRVPACEDASLVLVGFGSSSKPHHRRTTDYHAARLREQSDYGQVLTCYLLQNPAVECVRYNVDRRRAVAVPFFLSHSEATDERIPDELELERGGIEYAEPLGAHHRVTDAIEAELRRQRTLVEDRDLAGDDAVSTRQPIVTDGEGPTR